MSAVIYEVNLQVRPDLAAAYLAWLHGHVAEILALPGFEAATIARDREATDDGWLQLCCHYRLRDADALETYLREHAPRLRADGITRFGDGFRARRRILDLLG
ncbi:DUF4286 family protein [Arenimonas composti]|uniref:DUF4286 domain-containing protein n=1 Tax=Arenimonas composti TR7-09 = DSM 18010 TaxID=1121013 RepID=A0A091BEC5_9GAMM|nr:DUF4286 family protein [Arenimonas composti]KFN49877.1 hypothetical protein P873_08520 [Arenimonas composti TR7-09 = DSM 18010]